MLDRFIELAKTASFVDKVGIGLLISGIADLYDEYEKDQTKEAADQGDIAAAQVDQIRIQSNPVAQIVQQFMMKNPPQNLPRLVELMSQKLEQDLSASIQAGPGVSDPMLQANKNLKLALENLTLKQQIKQLLQQEAMQHISSIQQAAMMNGVQPDPAMAGPLLASQDGAVGGQQEPSPEEMMAMQQQQQMGGEGMPPEAGGGGEEEAAMAAQQGMQ